MEKRTRRQYSTYPSEAIEEVLSFITSHSDRNSTSLVCKSWFDMERRCRRHVYIPNCYAVSPSILTRRFTDVRSIDIKGRHFLANGGRVRDAWGAHALPWIKALVAAYPEMEEINLKRMVVIDECLELTASKLKNLRGLILHKCGGFSTRGLASIASNSRNLRKLDLHTSQVDDVGEDWISLFPDSFTSLECLNLYSLKDDSELPFLSLLCLVGRCPNLKALRLNSYFPLQKLEMLLLKAPQLADLATGSFTMNRCPRAFKELFWAFARCKGLKSLLGLWDVDPYYLPAIYPICSGLTFLDLNESTLQCPDLIKLLHQCPNLQRLYVLGDITDRGLEAVAASCKELRVLKVCKPNLDYAKETINVTERGLVSVAVGCPKLHSITYICNQMTNAALLTVAEYKPNLIRFKLHILKGEAPDYLTNQPRDNGLMAILERCKDLKSLWVTGLVTDRLLKHIGTHGKKLERLQLFKAGNCDLGLHHVLSGCSNLRKLTMLCCPFGGLALLANSDKLERIQFLWMSSCPVNYLGCKLLGEKHPRLNIEVMTEDGSLDFMSDECDVKDLYVYRTVAGPRSDMPAFVWSPNQKEPLQGL